MKKAILLFVSIAACLIIPYSAASAEKVVVHLDVTETPELEEWGTQAKELIEQWYQRTINLIPSKDFEVPTEVWLKIRKTDRGVAGTSGGRIGVSSGWIEKHPEDIGCVYHEMVHVIQNYKRGASGWLTEGIADYLRWAIYEGKSLDFFPYSDKPDGYRDSYRVTGGFFLWLEAERCPGIVKKLNTALRNRTYEGESFFEKETGTKVEELWADYLKERNSKKS